MHPVLKHSNEMVWQKSPAAKDSIWRRWSRSASQRWKRRKMIAALEAMDDHLLSDIGITRMEIESVVDAFDERELGMVPLAPKHQITYAEQGAIQMAA